MEDLKRRIERLLQQRTWDSIDEAIEILTNETRLNGARALNDDYNH